MSLYQSIGQIRRLENMQLSIGNAPCSWGIEFACDPRNPQWTRILDETKAAGYSGIELGPVGFMPEDPEILRPALAARCLTLTAGVVFQPFHDPLKWDQVLDAAKRTGRALAAHGVTRMVLVDSISPIRARTSGRPGEAERLKGGDLAGLHDRIRIVTRMAIEEFGQTVSFHAHAASWVEFEDELECILDSIDSRDLSVCLDTGHSAYAGFDPVAFYNRHAERVTYLHLKDVNPSIMAHVIEHRVGFYDAWALGLFTNLGKGIVNFRGLQAALVKGGYSGWVTVEQECDPQGLTSPLADARTNLAYLTSIGLA
jgi:inosose dehydratase